MAPHLGDQHGDVIDEAPAPILPWLERADQRMVAAPGVSAGVLVGRVIAAAHLPALEADTQMQPRVADLQALLAAIHGLGKLRDLDLIEVGAGRFHGPLLQVSLDGPGVTDLGVVGVGAGHTQGTTLTEEIPAAVELDLHGAESLAVGLERFVGVRIGLLASAELLLFCHEALDPCCDALIAHGSDSTPR